MVSRTPKKKTPKKKMSNSISKRGRRNTTTATPEKFSASSSSCSTHLGTAIHDSFHTCRLRLSKMFTKLACITTAATPLSLSPISKLRHRRTSLIATKTKKTASPCRSCFGKLQFPKFKKERVDPGEISLPLMEVRRPLDFNHHLPLPSSSLKGTIFLDLDETLIHSIPDPPPDRYDFMISPVIDGELMNFYVIKRPGAEDLLQFLNSRGLEVVVFTAGLKEYASLVLDELDREKVLISHRLYRDECKQIDGRYVKDLSLFGRDLSRAVIVDDNPGSYALQVENGVRVKAFVDDEDDDECWKLMGFFDWCLQFDDFREAVKVFESMSWSQSGRTDSWHNVEL